MYRFEDSYTRRYCIAEVVIILFFKKETEIKILVFQFPNGLLDNNILNTVVCALARATNHIIPVGVATVSGNWPPQSPILHKDLSSNFFI